ncbi:MAG: Rnase Y domain-containing protein, partial [Elusimicrobiota bacterium]
MLLHILFGFGIGFLSAYVLTLKFTGRLREMEVSRLKKKLAEVKSEADERYKKKEEEVENIKEQIKRDFERDTRSTRKEIKEQKEIISRRTKDLDKKADIIEKREKEIDAKDVEVEKMREALHKKEEELKHIKEREQETLEKISGMSPKQARQRLMKQIEEESKDEAQKLYKSIIESTRRDAKREAVEVIARAIQGNASEVTEELTVASFPLSDDDMKGRIIGREGRNIRALEAATGVNIIIDDTPGVISISSFDGMRREIARRALEELIKDGRIQPTRIEEIVAKVKKEVEDMIISEGEEAAVKANVIGLHDEEIKLLGKMRYRTSYGQNVLNHSVEVANLAGIMAEELDLDVDFARRAGLLHDLGKAIDRETEGSHVEIGSKLAKKYGESHRLQNAIL